MSYDVGRELLKAGLLYVVLFSKSHGHFYVQNLEELR